MYWNVEWSVGIT